MTIKDRIDLEDVLAEAMGEIFPTVASLPDTPEQMQELLEAKRDELVDDIGDNNELSDEIELDMFNLATKGIEIYGSFPVMYKRAMTSPSFFLSYAANGLFDEVANKYIEEVFEGWE